MNDETVLSYPVSLALAHPGVAANEPPTPHAVVRLVGVGPTVPEVAGNG